MAFEDRKLLFFWNIVRGKKRTTIIFRLTIFSKNGPRKYSPLYTVVLGAWILIWPLLVHRVAHSITNRYDNCGCGVLLNIILWFCPDVACRRSRPQGIGFPSVALHSDKTHCVLSRPNPTPGNARTKGVEKKIAGSIIVNRCRQTCEIPCIRGVLRNNNATLMSILLLSSGIERHAFARSDQRARDSGLLGISVSGKGRTDGSELDRC